MQETSSTKNNTFTIISYNIHHGANILDEYNLDKIISTINEQNPDLVCLQEVDNNYSERSNNEQQPDILQEKVRGMKKHVYQPTIENKYGILALLATDIELYHTTLLETGLKEDRTFQFFRLQNGFQIIHFHLSNQDSEYIRRKEELNKIFSYLDEKKVDYTKNTIICGDFNEDCEQTNKNGIENDSIFGLLKVKHFINSKNTYLQSKNISTENQPFTFTRKEYNRNIDHFFTSQDIKIDNFKVIESDASDHNPILLSILI